MDFTKISEALFEELLALHKELCLIPAPSGFEDARAAYVLNYLKKAGIENAHIDEAKNVVCTIGKPSDKMILFMAHTDTVFPMETPLNYTDDGTILRCPGVGDDTGSLATMLTSLKYIVQNNIVPNRTLMFVANACEEGLGNLKGCRQIFKDYGDKIEYMYTFDSKFSGIANWSVGSHRYEITAETEGGHSFGAFGNRNAIAVLAGIIQDIYSIEVPTVGNSKTTYNVGTIHGGTSVNTIAQSASMLCEYRSDDVDCLAIMQQKFAAIFEAAKVNCKNLKIDLVGERPCMSNNIDKAKQEEITDRAIAIQSKHAGCTVTPHSSSTDCNIPHSMGIPAVALANYNGGGAHTMEEWVEKESFKPGIRITLELVLTEGGVL